MNVTWTEHDTKMCKDGIQSGLAISVKTGKPLTLHELQSLARDFDVIRNFTSVDNFLEDKIKAVPFSGARI